MIDIDALLRSSDPARIADRPAVNAELDTVIETMLEEAPRRRWFRS